MSGRGRIRSNDWMHNWGDGGRDEAEPDQEPDLPPDPRVWPPPPTSGPPAVGAPIPMPPRWWEWVALALILLPFLVVILAGALVVAPIVWVRRKARSPLRRRRRRTREQRAQEGKL